MPKRVIATASCDTITMQFFPLAYARFLLGMHAFALESSSATNAHYFFYYTPLKLLGYNRVCSNVITHQAAVFDTGHQV
jgi:hypothetical protein